MSRVGQQIVPYIFLLHTRWGALKLEQFSGTIENEIKHLPCVAILKAFSIFPVMSPLLESITEND